MAASEEHDLAAAEFAAAAQDTSDSEALRVLNLLEQHHKKLGQLLKAAHERPIVREVSPPTHTAESENATPPPPQKQDSSRPASPETTIHPPRLPRGLRSSTRELSSSIASNLASARGIPSNRQKRPTPISPLVSTQNADGHIAQDDTRGKLLSRPTIDASDVLLSRSRHSQQRPSWAPPLSSPTKSEPTEQPVVQGSDAPFQQFYATFESLISKLSAPLAFAGLPLATPASKQSPTPSQPSPKPPKQPSRSTPAPPTVDYSQLISRAALRAVSGANPSNPAESFYVVPTTGGTISYAEIMSRAEREEARAGFRGSHHRQISHLTNISEDDFVDAQSTILPSIGPPSRFRRNGAEEVKVDGKTMEELALENSALKHLSDTLSKRLHVFEMSAQTSSAALAQSIRSLHNRSPMLSPQTSRGKPISGKSILGLDSYGNSTGQNDEATQRRITELEEILRKSDVRARKKEEENVKLKETITKYREKWDSLKAGAKARREREQGGRHGERPGISRTVTEETDVRTEMGEDESAAGG